MNSLTGNIGRRQFISAGSMAIGAGLAVQTSRLSFAAGRLSPQEPPAGGAPPQEAGLQSAAGGPPMQMSRTIKDDGTKYGKYIIFSEKSEGNDRGVPVANTIGMNSIIPEYPMALINRMMPPGPLPGKKAPERHSLSEYIIHLGNNPDDPMDLCADLTFCLGTGKWREKYIFNQATAVYVPAGFWHCPTSMKNIKRPVEFVNLMIGSPKTGFGETDHQPDVSEEEMAKAKTNDYLFSNYMVSGVGKDMKDPKGGKWIAYLDCSKIAQAPLTRIIRYGSEEASYPILETVQTHEYGTLLIQLGTDSNDATALGAELELYLGEEKEKHTISKSAIVYVPPKIPHGPMVVKNATQPFNFLEVVMGPELP